MEPLVVQRNPRRVSSDAPLRVLKNPHRADTSARYADASRREPSTRDAAWVGRVRSALLPYAHRPMAGATTAPRFSIADAARILDITENEVLDLAERGAIITSYDISRGYRVQTVRSDDLAKMLGRRAVQLAAVM
jgi:hypothetical protein